MCATEIKKEDLIRNINEMKNGSFEQMCLTTIYSLSSYFKSLWAFGRKSQITKDNLNIIKEMFNILSTERTLLNYILKNINSFDINATQNVIEMLDRLNDQTVLYYYDTINGIEDAVDLNNERRGLRPRNYPPTLIQSDAYAGEVIALSENIESLKSFLQFEDEFWEFIKDKVKKVNTSVEVMEKMVYAIPIYNDKGIVVSLCLMLPCIYNLESALLAIKVYKKAYEIYKMIGKNFDSENLEDSLDLQEEYKKEYLPRKAKDILGLKNVK